MREFRAKRVDNGEWVYGGYVHKEFHLTGTKAFIIEDFGIVSDKGKPSEIRHLLDFEVIPETVGQDTGLKDKDGKDLDWWEGDLLLYPDDYIETVDVGVGQVPVAKLPENSIAVIEFQQGCFGVKCSKSNTFYSNFIPFSQFLDEFDTEEINKIGTIHTHPNLLEKP